MSDADCGLMETYNRLKDHSATDTRIAALRELHEELDRAVLSVYGWNDLVIPPYCPVTDGDRAVSTTFEHAVFERLYALNAARSAAESAVGLPSEMRLPPSDDTAVDEPDWDEMQDLAVKHYRETAPTKDSDAVKSVDAMVNWFFERYDDPPTVFPTMDGRGLSVRCRRSVQCRG